MFGTVIYNRSRGILNVSGKEYPCSIFFGNESVIKTKIDPVTKKYNPDCHLLAYALETCDQFVEDLETSIYDTMNTDESDIDIGVVNLDEENNIYIIDGMIYDYNFEFIVVS